MIASVSAGGAHPSRTHDGRGLIALPGLVMGMCFPAGVRAAHAAGVADALPWMWALNGAASVLATFAAIVVAIEYGITASVLAGGALYLGAGAALLAVRKRG